MVHQPKKEVESVQGLYEAKLLELLKQIHSKTKRMEQVQLQSFSAITKNMLNFGVFLAKISLVWRHPRGLIVISRILS